MTDDVDIPVSPEERTVLLLERVTQMGKTILEWRNESREQNREISNRLASLEARPSLTPDQARWVERGHAKSLENAARREHFLRSVLTYAAMIFVALLAGAVGLAPVVEHLIKAMP